MDQKLLSNAKSAFDSFRYHERLSRNLMNSSAMFYGTLMHKQKAFVSYMDDGCEDGFFFIDHEDESIPSEIAYLWIGSTFFTVKAITERAEDIGLENVRSIDGEDVDPDAIVTVGYEYTIKPEVTLEMIKEFAEVD